MVKLILLNLLFLLGAVQIDSQNNSQKVVCYYDSRAFGKEGELIGKEGLKVDLDSGKASSGCVKGQRVVLMGQQRLLIKIS